MIRRDQALETIQLNNCTVVDDSSNGQSQWTKPKAMVIHFRMRVGGEYSWPWSEFRPCLRASSDGLTLSVFVRRNRNSKTILRVSLTRLFQASYDDRFEQGLIWTSPGKFRIYSVSNQFSNQIENYGSQWLSKIEWGYLQVRIATSFRPFARDSSDIFRIPITFLKTLH